MLEAAGQIFAEKGYERTSAKEIAKRAGINAAAVNYHFGGVDGLYLAVIAEARNRAVTFETLSNLLTGIANPFGKLKAILEYMVQLAIGPFAASWMARIYSREMLSPSPLSNRVNWRDFEKRLNLMREIVAEYLGLTTDDPDVAYVFWSLASPVTVLLSGDRKRFAQVYPEIDLSPDRAAAISEHLAQYAIGGLQAVRDLRKEAASSNASPKRPAQGGASRTRTPAGARSPRRAG